MRLLDIPYQILTQINILDICGFSIINCQFLVAGNGNKAKLWVTFGYFSSTKRFLKDTPSLKGFYKNIIINNFICLITVIWKPWLITMAYHTKCLFEWAFLWQCMIKKSTKYDGQYSQHPIRAIQYSKGTLKETWSFASCTVYRKAFLPYLFNIEI